MYVAIIQCFFDFILFAIKPTLKPCQILYNFMLYIECLLSYCSVSTFKHYFIECPMQSGSREDLFGILHNYTDDRSTSAILNIILQGVNIRDLIFKIIEAVSKYILESNRFT